MYKTKSSISAAKLLSKDITLFKNLPHREPEDFIIVLKTKGLDEYKLFYPHPKTNKHYDLEHYINETYLLKNNKDDENDNENENENDNENDKDNNENENENDNTDNNENEIKLNYYKTTDITKDNKAYSVKIKIFKNKIQIGNIIKYMRYDDFHSSFVDLDEDNEIKNKFDKIKGIYPTGLKLSENN